MCGAHSDTLQRKSHPKQSRVEKLIFEVDYFYFRMLIETSLLSGDWHRVEVTHVSGTKITCYFIDHGDEDLFGAEDLRELDPKFLELAPQAKQVRLSHLENWKDSSE